MASLSMIQLSRHFLRRSLPYSTRFLHEGPDTIDELLDRHLAKNDEESHRRSLTSTRREALSLYRDILRTSRYFTWPDSRGMIWRDVLRENARKEFEAARFETDPEIVTKLIIGGSEAVQQAVDKLVEGTKKMAEKEAEERSKGRR